MWGRWPALVRCFDDGRLALDNNPAERALRGVAIGRKNWLFAGSDAGGRRAAELLPWNWKPTDTTRAAT
jgi:transposase